jgi:hypothetical protein
VQRGVLICQLQNLMSGCFEFCFHIIFRRGIWLRRFQLGDFSLVLLDFGLERLDRSITINLYSTMDICMVISYDSKSYSDEPSEVDPSCLSKAKHRSRSFM